MCICTQKRLTAQNSENRRTAKMDSLLKEKVHFLKHHLNRVEEVQEYIYLFIYLVRMENTLSFKVAVF